MAFIFFKTRFLYFKVNCLKIMIKYVELENADQVLEKLNVFRSHGWSLNTQYTQIVPTLYGKYLLYYDEKLDLE